MIIAAGVDGHNMTEVVALIALAIQGLVMVGSAVWIVSRVKATTEVLAVSIVGLQRAVDRLDASIEAIDGRLSDFGERIARMEGQ